MSKNIPQILKEARYINRVTQEQLAELLGVTRVTVANWETGKHTPAVDVLWRVSSDVPWINRLIADLLDVMHGVVAVAAPEAEGDE